MKLPCQPCVTLTCCGAQGYPAPLGSEIWVAAAHGSLTTLGRLPPAVPAAHGTTGAHPCQR